MVAMVQSRGPQRPAPETILRTYWKDDALAQLILRAATSPTKTSDFPQQVLTRVLPTLAPKAASSRLFGLAQTIDLTGVATVTLPYIGASGRPNAVFVAEGSPGPVVNLITSAVTLGPAKKLLVLASLTNEVRDASGGTAEQIISDALTAAIEQSMDALLFSTSAATAAAPAGILAGLTPIDAATGGGAEAIATDVGHLAEAIGKAGINPDTMVVITTPYLATKARSMLVEAPEIFSSPYLPDGQVVGIVPEGLATGYDG
jgi:HK97 family phage major capsid protein